MERLLRKAMDGRLSASQEQDLRRLVTRRNPRAADLPSDVLVQAGLVLVGTDALREALFPLR